MQLHNYNYSLQNADIDTYIDMQPRAPLDLGGASELGDI